MFIYLAMLATANLFATLLVSTLAKEQPRFDMSHMVGAEYTPWKAGNQFWWHDYKAYRADVVRELNAVRDVVGFTTIRVFLHDLLWVADAEGLKANINDFLSILEGLGMRAGLVFFDDCWRHEGMNLTWTCTPMQGVHNGCWAASPQDVDRHNGVEVFKDYVIGVVKAFAHDIRVAWWEIFNEPQRHNQFSLALRDAGFRWATALNPIAPVISCWDDNNNTEVVDTHEYSIPNDRSPVLQNASKGGIVTEAGARWYQGQHDYGSPLAWLNWLDKIGTNESSAPFKPGVMLSWEVMVGHSQTRWHWSNKMGDKEPAVPWCGFIYPDGSPVSYTEAAALRMYNGGKNDFFFVAQWRDTQYHYLRIDTLAPWDGWKPDNPPVEALYEISVWPDAATGKLVMTAGGYDITLDTFAAAYDCQITQELGCYQDAKARTLPTPVGGGFGGMTHEYCANLGMVHGFNSSAYCGVEDLNQCWCGTGKPDASKLKLPSERCSTPCPGNSSQQCGAPYIMNIFQSNCKEAPKKSVNMQISQAGRGPVLASLGIETRLVQAAWNIVRILVTKSHAKVWLNPNFADIVGASVPPEDEKHSPQSPAPLLDISTPFDHVPSGLHASVTGGGWNVEYASVLPPVLYTSTVLPRTVFV